METVFAVDGKKGKKTVMEVRAGGGGTPANLPSCIEPVRAAGTSNYVRLEQQSKGGKMPINSKKNARPSP